MLKQRETTTQLSGQTTWDRYCGFLDLNLEDFLLIQEQRLIDWLPRLADSAVGRVTMDSHIPGSVREFRRTVPLTRIEDYLPYLKDDSGRDLPDPTVAEAKTIRRNCEELWVPYTQEALGQLLDNSIAVLLLASASERDKSKYNPGDRILYNLPPAPFLSGLVADELAGRLDLRSVVDPKHAEKLGFQKKMSAGFTTALHTGADAVASLTSVLVKMGERFESQRRGFRLSKEFLHPKAAFRLLRALIVSKREGRPMLPKDLWDVKALACWGWDTQLYRERLTEYWGVEPHEFAAATESGMLAMQSWARKEMTFLSTPNFLEFIPEDESRRSLRDPVHEPATLLLDELEPGQRYEVVITSCTGMPFIRYRLGLLVEMVGYREEETGIELPQVRFIGRVDDLIDIAGFTRIDTMALEHVFQTIEVPVTDWVARKEVEDDAPVLRFYVEPQNGSCPDLAARLHEGLMQQDRFYQDLNRMLGLEPVRVTLLEKGTFQQYYSNKGFDSQSIGQRQFPKTNLTDGEVVDLLRVSTERVLSGVATPVEDPVLTGMA